MVVEWSPFVFWVVIVGCLAVASPIMAGLTLAAAGTVLLAGRKR
ncbi:hypothetical protein QRX50_13645 [Amycolatopsis carbonis]|uniref:Uncharacterized protein n=1 Tax=Amycolatopsis carbonis TaxID=715471 RepID=A0A9Y2IN86_9PSEU|nr:hypothetical protein [Amycolatopsis sp. 2-15]WIX81723.1 hypothetical protein QRX50_13645 [Amycolatopsis sp. 2-15]